MILVVDASVAIKWFLRFRPDEEDSERALRILEGAASGTHTLIAPPHFLAEVAAVLAREKPRAALADMNDLQEILFERAESPEVYARATAMAIRLDHHVFDTLYHAAALCTPDATLITADRRYYGKARLEGRIRLLADLEI